MPFVFCQGSRYVRYRAQHVLQAGDTLANLMQGRSVMLLGSLWLWQNFLDMWTSRVILLEGKMTWWKRTGTLRLTLTHPNKSLRALKLLCY